MMNLEQYLGMDLIYNALKNAQARTPCPLYKDALDSRTKELEIIYNFGIKNREYLESVL